jgi:hypothetical protein
MYPQYIDSDHYVITNQDGGETIYLWDVDFDEQTVIPVLRADWVDPRSATSESYEQYQ